MEKFNKGDVVVLKSGGTKWTIADIYPDEYGSEFAEIMQDDKGQLKSHHVHIEILAKVEPEQ